MPDPSDEHDTGVLNGIQDAIVPYSDSKDRRALQHFGATRSRIRCQAVDGLADTIQRSSVFDSK